MKADEVQLQIIRNTMKGHVLGFTEESGGAISGDDGNRYTFVAKDWLDETLPEKGARVDFQVEDDVAVAIYADVTPRKVIEPLKVQDFKPGLVVFLEVCGVITILVGAVLVFIAPVEGWASIGAGFGSVALARIIAYLALIAHELSLINQREGRSSAPALEA